MAKPKSVDPAANSLSDPALKGDPEQKSNPDPKTDTEQKQGLGITALLVGIVGLFISWIPGVGLLLPIIAIGLGYFGMKHKSGHTMSLTGLILGCIGIFIALVVIIVAAIG